MNKKNIGIITTPITGTGIVALSDLIEIVSTYSNETLLITGWTAYEKFESNSKVRAFKLNSKSKQNPFLRMANYIYIQLQIFYYILNLNKKVDIYIFFLGGVYSPIPMILAKFFRAKVILFLAGAPAKIEKYSDSNFHKLYIILSRSCYYISDLIILHSKNLVDEWDLKEYDKKILVARGHFLDFDKYYIAKKLDERKNLIGYLGRLSQEKGVLNFIKSIQKLIDYNSDLNFVIIGDGPLENEIKKYIRINNLGKKVELLGFIEHDSIPHYLNNLKILVIPSFTEGGPYVMLEAMACGTIVCATPVGLVPEVIIDGYNGFIIENNSPDCIAKNVIRAMEQSDLEIIAERGRILMKQEFSFEVSVRQWERILSS